jgi:gamma-glutamyl-gamma-aminobutyraldehyde dehydrogenase
MTSLTRDDALAIAGALELPSRPFIGGDYRQVTGGRSFKSINPANGEILVEIEGCNSSDLDSAVSVAKATFESGVWSQKHPSERKAVLLHFAELIKRNLQKLAVLESLDSGKPITDCLTVDVPLTAATIAWHAEAQDKLSSRIASTDKTRWG